MRAFELVYTPENLLYVNIQNGFVDYEVSMELNSLHLCGIFWWWCICGCDNWLKRNTVTSIIIKNLELSAIPSTKQYILCKYVYQMIKFLLFYFKCSRIYFYSNNQKTFKEVKPNVIFQWKINIEHGARYNYFVINSNIISTKMVLK